MHDPRSRTVRSPPGAVGRAVARAVIRTALAAHWMVTTALRRLRRQRPGAGPVRVLLTGTFHSEHWIAAHVAPLAASPHCAGVVLVASSPVPPVAGVTPIYPPRWLRRVAGGVGARLATFVWVALRSRPDVVGGFHLLVNGLAAQTAAAACGARSLYFCVGGPTELAGGGYAGENPYFARLGTPDPVVERQLLRAACAFDEIVAMGSGAAGFFTRHGASGRVHVIGGAIDPERCWPGTAPSEFDVIFVGRLVPIKQVDRVLGALAHARASLPRLRAAIVGDGPLRGPLEALAAAYGLADRVTFAGQQADAAAWLRRSRVFVLASASEGVSLSLMEAAMCGLPAVVPAVGDLADVVADGVNGCVVADPSDARLGDALVRALADEARYQAWRRAALEASRRYTPGKVSALWAPVLMPSRAGAGDFTPPLPHHVNSPWSTATRM